MCYSIIQYTGIVHFYHFMVVASLLTYVVTMITNTLLLLPPSLQEFEQCIDGMCHTLGLSRAVQIALSEAAGVSKVEHFQFLLSPS